jgi:hypothetical protein
MPHFNHDSDIAVAKLILESSAGDLPLEPKAICEASYLPEPDINSAGDIPLASVRLSRHFGKAA